MVKDTTNFLHNEEIFSYVHQLLFGWKHNHYILNYKNSQRMRPYTAYKKLTIISSLI